MLTSIELPDAKVPLNINELVVYSLYTSAFAFEREFILMLMLDVSDEDGVSLYQQIVLIPKVFELKVDEPPDEESVNVWEFQLNIKMHFFINF